MLIVNQVQKILPLYINMLLELKVHPYLIDRKNTIFEVGYRPSNKLLTCLLSVLHQLSDHTPLFTYITYPWKRTGLVVN